MNINENNAYDITERLAFPRLVGTPGEKKAIKIVDEELRKAGYDNVIHEEFKTSNFIWIVSRWIFIIVGIPLLIGAFFFSSNHWITLICLGIFYICLIKGLSYQYQEDSLFSKNEKHNFLTENIYTNLKSKNSKIKVFLVGHYDSKGQVFPKVLTIIVFNLVIIIAFLLSSTYLLLCLIKIFFPFSLSILDAILFYMTLIIYIIGCSNFLNKINNKSPGAADDGAAVGAIIEMARFYKENPLDNVDFTFLLTGSEELNTGGARDYIKKHKSELDKKNTYFINLDGFGGDGTINILKNFGIPKKSGSKKLIKLFAEGSKELNIPVRMIYVPTGAWSDFIPIVQAGFQTCWIDAMSGGIKYTHTKKDNMSLISKNGLKNGMQLCIKVINKLNEV